MNVDWISDDDEILINFVRAHELLYNVKHKYYRKTVIKQKLWQEVGDLLNRTSSPDQDLTRSRLVRSPSITCPSLSGTDCYKRWCYVRDYYIRRKGKPGIKSSRETSKKRSDLLTFLDKFISSQRNSVPNDDEDESSGENTEEKLTFTYDLQETKYNATTREGDSSTVRYKNENSDESDQDNEKKLFEGINMTNCLKRKNNSRAQEWVDPLEQNVQRNPPNQNDLDENDLFFSSMAKIVKRLPRYDQVHLRMQIGSLIGNAELRFIPIDSQKPNTSASYYSEIVTPSTRPNTAKDPSDFLQINIVSPPPNSSAASNNSETANTSRIPKFNFNK